MPPANHPVLATAGVVVISVVAAAAVAIYESPEVRQFAEGCRRKIAVALHNLGDEIHPNRSRQPRFNRPEDAEGFMQSGAAGVDADEESKKRQREELMYWNRIHLEKMEQETEKNRSRASTFDDFLHEDKTAEKGTLVYNSSAETNKDIDGGLVQRRGEASKAMANGALFANPFADENQIEMEPAETTETRHVPTPPLSEQSSQDIYTADDLKLAREITRESTATLATDDSKDVETDEDERLVNVSEPATPTSESSVPDHIYHSTMTSGDEAHPDSVFASIQAWADNSNQSFYSPLPGTPLAHSEAAPSEPEHISGELTPTDSASLAGSGEHISASEDGTGRYYDVVSEDGNGVLTPSSWTEVGSTVSESDAGHR
jgi:hypothetical protein